MNWYEAIVLGIVQGLTEFLPVSSSGHIELGKALFQVDLNDNLLFSVVVHLATAMSTIIVFRVEIARLAVGATRFRLNDETIYLSKILLSMVPVAAFGLIWRHEIEGLFTGNILLVGSMLIVTALLLAFTYFKKSGNQPVSFRNAFLIGIAQAIAILPGISRSGATISTALLLGVDKDKATRFSFLMVLLPILGASLLELLAYFRQPEEGHMAFAVLAGGFLAAFLSGLFACSLMIRIVRSGKLIYFAAYCVLAGAIAITVHFL